MKSLFKSVLITGLAFLLLSGSLHAINIHFRGKGGIVILPNGNKEICPDFSFRKCYTIKVTWQDIKNFFTGDNQGASLQATASIYDDNEIVCETVPILITWVNPAVIVNDPGPDLELEKSDMEIIVLD